MMAWLDRVKTRLGWDETDQERILEFRRWMDSDLSGVAESLGEELSQLKGAQPLMVNARFAQRLHRVLYEWLMGLMSGTFDEQYVRERRAFGRRLMGADLTFEDVITLEGLVRNRFFELAQEQLGEHPETLSATMHTLDKALNLDLALIYNGYLQVHDNELERVLLDRFLAITGFSRTLYENLAEARGRRLMVSRIG